MFRTNNSFLICLTFHVLINDSIQTFHNLSKSLKMLKCMRYCIIFIFLMGFLTEPLPCSTMGQLSFMPAFFVPRSLFMSIMVIHFISPLGWKYCFWFISSFLVCSFTLKNSAFSSFLNRGNTENIFLRTCLAKVYLSYPKS